LGGGGGFSNRGGDFSKDLLGVLVRVLDLFDTLAIKSWHSAVVLCTTFAACGSKTGLRLLDFKKFTPIITGRDKFFKTTAEPEKMVDIWLNLILTSNCPTVSIVEFELAPFAELKSDGFKSLILPCKLLVKKSSLIATPVGIRAPVSIKILEFIKVLPE